MDWFFKTTSWDFGEFQQEADPSVNSSEELNNSSLKKKGECSVDLKLGRIGDSIDGMLSAWSGSQSGAKASQSNPPKRVRKVVTANQTVFCSVDGCKSDLSGCRDYHKRHKVCEVHAKTPMVMVGGLQQRFCQQCSRFHLLKEFDEIKRSCRKRLDGHNRRRRKVQPDAESVNSASFLHGLYPVGDGFSSSPQIWTGNRQNAAWPGTSSSRHQPSINYLEQQPLFPLYSGNRRISSSYQPNPNRITSSDSNRALSLLSLSNPSLDIDAVHAVQAETIFMAHHLNHPKCFTSSGSGSDLRTGKSCSQVSNCMSTSSLPSTERENQLENTNLVSTGVDVAPCILTFDIAGAQTEPVYSPPPHGLPVFWPT